MVDLLSLDNLELQGLLKELGEPSFRAKQIFSWLHKGVDFSGMKNLPKGLIDKLSSSYIANPVKILETYTSKIDGTIKLLYLLPDNNIVEGVLMKYKYGNTLCVSTQVGCRMGCKFCASCLDGLIRNLTAGEILGQIVAVNKFLGGDLTNRAITNVVLMGSGEPLDNYDNVTKFFKLLEDKNGLNISMRNISLSTSGLCNNIYRLADEGYHITLTISLHSSSNEYRSSIMPINKKYPIEELMKAAKYYFDKTGRRVIFEYCMIEGVTDSEEQAKKLAEITKGFPTHINLIRLNKVKERDLNRASEDSIQNFLKVLEDNGASATIRRTLGSDIDGACGQLRRKYLSGGKNH